MKSYWHILYQIFKIFTINEINADPKNYNKRSQATKRFHAEKADRSWLRIAQIQPNQQDVPPEPQVVTKQSKAEASAERFNLPATFQLKIRVREELFNTANGKEKLQSQHLEDEFGRTPFPEWVARLNQSLCHVYCRKGKVPEAGGAKATTTAQNSWIWSKSSSEIKRADKAEQLAACQGTNAQFRAGWQLAVVWQAVCRGRAKQVKCEQEHKSN